MENYSHKNVSELRKTLEYAEAVILLGQQRELEMRRCAIRQQLSALRRLSKRAVEIARNDIRPGQLEVLQQH